jgi:hypothetical protein
MNNNLLTRITGITALVGILAVTGSVSTLFAYFSTNIVSTPGCTDSGYGYQA